MTKDRKSDKEENHGRGGREGGREREREEGRGRRSNTKDQSISN
jgi:hypothetical protein